MRRLFLYDKFFASPLPLPEIMHRVEQVTALPNVGWKAWLDIQPDRPCRGEVYSAEGVFELESSTNRPNSLFPTILGEVVLAGSGAGSVVRLTICMRPVRQFLATTWLAVMGTACLFTLAIRPGWVGVIPFLLLGGAPFSFWSHVWEEKRFFKNLLQLVESLPAA